MESIVILPTFNEAENIEELVSRIFTFVPFTKVLVVDGGSPDGTASIVESMQAHYPNLKLLKQKTKNGLGHAYIEGFKFVINNMSDVKKIIMMDADFSHDPKHLSELIRLSAQFDVVT